MDTGVSQSWNTLFTEAQRAKNNSVGIRRKVSSVIFKLHQSTLMPQFSSKDFGWNHIPNRPREPLEWRVGQEGVEYSLEELNELGPENLVSKPHVRHAEIHALLLHLSSELRDECNALFTTASCCLDCAKQIVTYADFIQVVVFCEDYSCPMGVAHLKENGVIIFRYDPANFTLTRV